MAKGSSLKSWQEVLNMTKNSKIRKIIKQKMKAGVTPGKVKAAIREWQSLSNPGLKKAALQKMKQLS